VEMASLQGEPARARTAAKGVRERLLELPAPDAEGRERVAAELRRLHRALGWSELQAGDAAAAQEHFIHVAQARKRLPTQTLLQQREAADDAALLAITLARGGRTDEARALAEPALAWQREHQAQQIEHAWREWSLALALLAVAESSPTQRAALLAEAQAALERLPAEPRAARTGQMLQGLIADARRAGR
jgi:hypothetical protein